MNVPPIERIATGALGAAALTYGLGRRDPLGYALAAGGALLGLRAATGRCPGYRRLLASTPVIDVSRSVTILSSRSTVYRVFRDFEHLPAFLEHVAHVEVTGPRSSRWTIGEGPLSLTWDADITEEIEGRRLAWESRQGGGLEAEGALELRDAPGDRGTELTLQLRYLAPGPLGLAPFRRLLSGMTGHQLGRELGRLRQLLETGAISTGARRPELAGDKETASTASLGVSVPRRRQVRADARTQLTPAGRQ